MVHKSNIPIATYRLQFNNQFTFQNAIDLVDYFHELGISHCYASPLLKAKPGSIHGYDIVDHSVFNPEIGTQDQFERYIQVLRNHRMGLICDIVPNHMYIVDPSNQWWNDVLENGPSSPYADYFDIDWNPPRTKLINKVLLPLLEQQYGEALENQALKVTYQEGVFLVRLPNAILPTDPKSWNLILEPLAKEAEELLPGDNSSLLELKSIMTALTHLPSTTETEKEKIEERLREKEIIKKRLSTLINQSDALSNLIQRYLILLNGKKNDPRSFDWLESFINAQSYRLCNWRVASDEINYRRFFDVFELAGLRTEKPEVFNATHVLIIQQIQKEFIDGIRIDHIDGLRDPKQYFQRLQQCCKKISQEDSVLSNDKKAENADTYIIVEKILIGNEKLSAEWPIHGTVGYDFLNQLNGLFVLQTNKRAIHEIYRNFTGVYQSPFEQVYSCKKLILIVSMSSELSVLSRHLDRISAQHRSSRDFTAESLRAALREVIACFPVYRSYIRADENEIHEEDKHEIHTAIFQAKRLNPAMDASIFDFIQSVLLLEYPLGLDQEQIEERKDFVMRFQQLTGPVMAKGVEDTAFYRYYPLLSLNEVGANPYGFGISLEAFHKLNQERCEAWPCTMLTTSTHDTKRSEDVRARINVLSEIPEDWKQALERWSQYNQGYKSKDGEDEIPDANEEYLLYQTLIGSWPLYSMDSEVHHDYLNRIQAYMEKAIKEAKIHSSWLNPNKDYDQGMRQFIEIILNLDASVNPFLNDFTAFASKIHIAGMFNSLSQLLIKLTSPGVPDIYQGTELWNFCLVDPDNRKPVNYENGKNLLQELNERKKAQSPDLLEQLMESPEDGLIKLFVTTQTLQLRQRLATLFMEGSYLPLTVQGGKQNHVIAYARILGNQAVLVIASRFFIPLMQETRPHIDSSVWHNTSIVLPPELNSFKFRNVYSGTEHLPEKNIDRITLNLEQVLSPIPIALLEVSNA